jgi:hypothetical protein
MSAQQVVPDALVATIHGLQRPGPDPKIEVRNIFICACCLFERGHTEFHTQENNFGDIDISSFGDRDDVLNPHPTIPPDWISFPLLSEPFEESPAKRVRVTVESPLLDVTRTESNSTTTSNETLTSFTSLDSQPQTKSKAHGAVLGELPKVSHLLKEL